MHFAYHGIVPPKEWEHNPNIETDLEDTVEDFLKRKGIYVPY